MVQPSQAKSTQPSAVVSIRDLPTMAHTPGDRVGLNWRIPVVTGKRSVRHAVFDTNYWKSFVHARLAVPMGDPGCLSLHGRKPEAHRLLAEHLTAEYRVKTEGCGRTVDELRRAIDGSLRSLGAMPWNPDDEMLDAKVGSCTNCPRRSSQQPMLFPDADNGRNGRPANNDRCLDPACFDRKHVAHVSACECRLRAKHPNLHLVQIGAGSPNPAIEEAFGDRVQRLYTPKVVRATNPNAVPVIQVDGPKAGKLVFVDGGDSVADHRNGQSPRPPDADGKVVPMTLAERRARLQKRRDAFAVKHVKEFLDKLTVEQAAEIVSPWTQRRINREAGANPFDPVALLTAFGSTKRADYVDEGEAWREYDSLLDAEPIQQAAAALMSVVQVWIRRLNIQSSHTVGAQAADARRMCRILGLDFEAIEDEARRAIPEPKSWANLLDDNSPTDSAATDSSDCTDSARYSPADKADDSAGTTPESIESLDDHDPSDAVPAESGGETDGDYPDWPATRGPRTGCSVPVNAENRRQSDAVSQAV